MSTNELKHLVERVTEQCKYCVNYIHNTSKSFQAHALTQQHIKNVYAFVMNTDQHNLCDDAQDDDDYDDDDCADNKSDDESNNYNQIYTQQQSIIDQSLANNSCAIDQYLSSQDTKPLSIASSIMRTKDNDTIMTNQGHSDNPATGLNQQRIEHLLHQQYNYNQMRGEL